MESQYFIWLSTVVFLPAIGAFFLMFAPNDKPDQIKLVSLFITVAVFALTLIIPLGMLGPESAHFDKGVAEMQDAFSVDWIPSFNIYYLMGMDGISFTLVVLTSFLSMLAMWASWPIQKHVKAYCILYLLLETGMLGVFLALDFFLFYVFWEVMLLPMYFLIGVWGGPRREYAAIKFFLYTLLGSVLMLIAILMLYFNSDLTRLADSYNLPPDNLAASKEWQALHLSKEVTRNVAHVLGSLPAGAAPEVETAFWRNTPKIHTFNILALAKMGQRTDLFDAFDIDRDGNKVLILGHTPQWWAFLLLFIGFAIKVPIVPLHTWLPDAHVEAPTPISMILAGVLLKMGGYGIIRICYPICPDAGYDLAWMVTGIGVVSMLYGAFAAMAQKDFKRLVAYSSVSHMGYVMLGMGVWSATAGTNFNADAWKLGMNGAMFQMIAHGISSAGMFFMVGVIYDRVHHRNLDEFGGLFAKAPVYSGLAFGIFFAGLGLPGLCGFIGEVFVTLSVWNYSQAMAVISASTVILTAGYILWTLQRVYLGPEYRGPHGDHITEIDLRERCIAAPILAFAILLGIAPDYFVFRYMQPSVDQTVKDLARWTRDVKEPRLLEEKATVADDLQRPRPRAAALPRRPVPATARARSTAEAK
ncbi:MAG TPA: NADH-quinone oxidoreductase subunit M [Pirellulales bacterium]|nr:NADH-quinone oxidoreductase subunit M [Pirellulales bacterium]